MSIYVLVHGAWHGAWSWHNIIPLLEKQGHTIVAPDLPGHGLNHSIPPSAVTLRAYTDYLSGIIKEQDEPVILVGHSMGGIVISQTAEECSDMVQKLVYVSAFLVPNGMSLTQYAQTDEKNLTVNPMRIDEAHGVSTFAPEGAKEVFYHDCPENEIALARLLLVPNALEPFVATLNLSDKYEDIPRFYVECLNDRAIIIEAQRFMYNRLPCERVFTLSTGHSPFFAAPENLAEILISVA